MKIRDVIARDLSQRIEPIVKVYDRARLAEELRGFVITDSLSRELRKFCDNFTDSLNARIRGGKPGDGMAVWIWGFFGSGKSHVAKVLGNVLQNEVVEPDEGHTAIDLFAAHLDDPTLAGAADLKASLAEIRNKAWCKTIAFEIKSEVDASNPDSVTEACLRKFYESLGLATTIWLARLERKLQTEGRYEDFRAAYSAATGRAWETDRLVHGYYTDEITAALAAALGRELASAQEMVATYQRDHARVTPALLAQELNAYLAEEQAHVKPREPHLIFVIDEMGQFIADSSDRIHELQSIVEQAGVEGRGRIWFVCTSQEALDKVVDRTGLKLSALGKLDARFSTKIPLTGEDVRRVVQDRLLRKREATLPELRALYAGREGLIEELSALRLERKLAVVDRDAFTASYPFLPYAVPLVQELFNAMRGFKLSGTERSMIGMVQGALLRLAGQPVGALAPLDVIFDQVTDELSSADYLGTTGIKLIRESDERLPGTPVQPSRVLKALWLISRVEWVPRTPEVLAKLLAGDLEADLAQVRADVQATLDRLQKAGLVGRDEATSQYRYLSEKERGVEEDIADFIQDLGGGIGVARRRAAALLKDRVLTSSRWNGFKAPLGKHGIVPFALLLDDEPVSSGGEITVRLYSPLAAPKLADIEQENLGNGAKGRTLWWIADEESSLVEKLKRIEALDKVPDRAKWKNDRSDETVRVLKEKEKELATLESHVAGLLETCLKRGKVYYAGEAADLDGSKELKTVAAELAGVVAGHLYTRHAVADKAFDEKNIPAYLKPGTKTPALLDPELGLFDAQGHLVRTAPLVEALFEELQRRRDESLDLDGRAVAEHFGRVPFGWPEALVRLTLAAMLRGGALYLEPPDSDAPVYEAAAPGVESIFAGGLKFRKARFIPTSGGLTPADVKEAKEALAALGETGVADSANSIAERVRTVGARMVQESDKVRQRVEDLSLPLPDTYRLAEPTTKPALALRDPVACARKFLEGRAAWKEVGDYLAAYVTFIEGKRDTAYLMYAAVLTYARACGAVVQGTEGVPAQVALAEFDAVVAAREVMSKWVALREAAETAVGRYRQVYKAAHQTCVVAVAGLRGEIEALEAHTRLKPERQGVVIAAFFATPGPLALPTSVDVSTVAALRAASMQRKVSELDALRLALPGYRDEILARLEAEWQAQAQAEAGTAQEKPDYVLPKPARVKLSSRIPKSKFDSRQAFVEFWGKLGQEIAAELPDDGEVILEP